MFIKYFIGGFFSKTIASFDDAVTRIPVVAQLTKTRKGRIAFSIGNLLAVTVVIVIAWFFSSLLEKIPYTRTIASLLILSLALAIYFDFFGEKKAKKIEMQKEKIIEQVFLAKFFRLVVSGFVISFVTLIDDIMVLTPLFLGPPRTHFYAVMGIYASTSLQLVVMVHLAKKMSKLKYVKEMAITGLVVLACLVYLGFF